MLKVFGTVKCSITGDLAQQLSKSLLIPPAYIGATQPLVQGERFPTTQPQTGEPFCELLQKSELTNAGAQRCSVSVRHSTDQVQCLNKLGPCEYRVI